MTYLIGCGYCMTCGYGGDPSDDCPHKIPAGNPYVLTSEHITRATLTLGEVRWLAGEAYALANTDGLSDAFTPHEREVIDARIGETGGKVTGLRGRNIEVRRVEWDELADGLTDLPDDPRERHEAILQAFNKGKVRA